VNGPFSARGCSDVVMTTTLSVAVMAEFDAPSSGKLANSDDDECYVSTADPWSRQTSNTSSESEASWELPVADTRGGDKVIEERKHNCQTKQIRPASEHVLMSLPHFREACSVAEDSSEDEEAVLRIGQLARRYALGRRADACSSH